MSKHAATEDNLVDAFSWMSRSGARVISRYTRIQPEIDKNYERVDPRVVARKVMSSCCNLVICIINIARCFIAKVLW